MMKSCTEKLTHKICNLFWWKIYNSDDLFSYEFICCIILCYLCTTLFYSYFLTKIYPYFIGFFICFWKVFCTDDSPNSEFYWFEFWPWNRGLHRIILLWCLWQWFVRLFFISIRYDRSLWWVRLHYQERGVFFYHLHSRVRAWGMDFRRLIWRDVFLLVRVA